MLRKWSLQKAKNQLSEVVDRSKSEGPQLITRHGKEESVLMSIENFRKNFAPKNDFLEFLQNSPLAGINLDIKRNKRKSERKVELY